MTVLFRSLVTVACLATLFLGQGYAYFEEFEHENLPHEKINPAYTCTDSSCMRITLTFKAYGRDFVLRLMENQEIFTQDFHVILDGGSKRGHSFEREAKSVTRKCKYLLSRDVTLTATISICDKDKISGLLSIAGSTFLVRYAEQRSDLTPSDPESSGHFVFHYEDIPCATGRCLDADPIQKVKQFLTKRTVVTQHRVRSTDPTVTPKYVELVLVYDQATLKHIESIPGETVIAWTAKLVNMMNSVYSKLSISIMLRDLILWTEKDNIPMYNEIEDTLLVFADYNIEAFDRKRPQDATLLITWHRFIQSPGILGIAFKSHTCENCVLAVAVIAAAEGFDVTHVAGIASHELGHCLGFDDEYYDKRSSRCFAKCDDPADHLSCIMRGVYASGSTAWSECSKERVIDREISQSYDCLYNQPKMSSVVAVCGNGVIEKAEECDCPSNDVACGKCCNMTSCKLTKESQCSSELCCQSCSIIQSNDTVCRRVRDERCDFEDRCDGWTSACIDSYKKDESECGQDRWCIQGRCEFRCLANCYGHGKCIKGDEDWECRCHSLSWGRYCIHQLPASTLVALSLCPFLLTFLLTFLCLSLIKRCCYRG